MAASIAACFTRQAPVIRQFSARFQRCSLCTSAYRSQNDTKHLRTHVCGTHKLQLTGHTKIPLYQAGKVWLPWQLSVRGCASSSEEATEEAEEYHSIIKNTERSRGPGDELEFQAETRKLLDIVAHSLYSEKEVFIRELISNASDALEKLRYLQMTDEKIVEPDTPLEVHIATDDSKKTFTIQDTGIGMSKEDMVANLGTIARSGTKAFLDSMKSKANGEGSSNIIGQFGVGFYSSFMVGDKVDVYSQSYQPGSPAYKWSSDGAGTFEIAEAEGVQRGTKIVIHLKGENYDYCKEEIIKDVIKKYSNFVGVPIFLNGQKTNVVQALWMMEPKDVTEDMHEEFYRFVANLYDQPRYHIHYKTDAPINIRALFYVPKYKPTLYDMSRETDVSLQLYSRKVMIMSKANTVLPKWLRFVRGVVDSEDIPLNLSRELLQDSSLIRKLSHVLTNRLLKFFSDQARKDPVKYREFYEDYGLFFREGIVTTPEQEVREDISKLMRFESSKTEAGELTSLEEYSSRLKAGTREIYYLSVPSRELAESSPYMEAVRKRDVEVLFLYEPYDELVLMNLGQYDKKFFKSIENEMLEENEDKVDEGDTHSLKQSEFETLSTWLKATLQNRVQKVKVTKRLSSHPCVVTVAEMGSARHFLKTTMADKSADEKFRLLQPTLEINPSHPLIKKLHELQASDQYLAKLLAEQLCADKLCSASPADVRKQLIYGRVPFAVLDVQDVPDSNGMKQNCVPELSQLCRQNRWCSQDRGTYSLYDNAMVNAGLHDDPRSMVTRINQLLELALKKESKTE